MLGKIPNHDQAEALRLHLVDKHTFWSYFPIASVSMEEPSFSDDMWRGATWPNMNLLLYYALKSYGYHEEAVALAHHTIEEISRWWNQTGCLYEYYDSLGKRPPYALHRKGGIGEKGGVGFGVVEDLHWTAAVYIHFAHIL